MKLIDKYSRNLYLILSVLFALFAMLSVVFYEASDLSRFIILAIFLTVSLLCLILSLYHHIFKFIRYDFNILHIRSFGKNFTTEIKEIKRIILFEPEYTNTNSFYSPIRMQMNKVNIICKNDKVIKFKHLGKNQEEFWKLISEKVKIVRK